MTSPKLPITINAEQALMDHLGLSKSTINGFNAYGHGGFWATTVQYIPKLNTSIAVFVLEKDHKKLRKDILETLVKQLQQ